MPHNERILALAKYHIEGVITDDEFVTQFIQEILNGNLTSIVGLSEHIPRELADKFLGSIVQLENDDYVDTYPFNRFESIEERRMKANRLKHQYILVFAEMREFFDGASAG